MTGWQNWQKSFWLWCVIYYTTYCSYCGNRELHSFKYLDIRTAVCTVVTEWHICLEAVIIFSHTTHTYIGLYACSVCKSEKFPSVQANLSFSFHFLRFPFFLLSSLLPSQFFHFSFFLYLINEFTLSFLFQKEKLTSVKPKVSMFFLLSSIFFFPSFFPPAFAILSFFFLLYLIN